MIQIDGVNKKVLPSFIEKIMDKKDPKNIFKDLQYIPFGPDIPQIYMQTLVVSQAEIQESMTYAYINHIPDIDKPLQLADSQEMLSIRKWLLKEKNPRNEQVFHSIQKLHRDDSYTVIFPRTTQEYAEVFLSNITLYSGSIFAHPIHTSSSPTAKYYKFKDYQSPETQKI